MRWTLVEVSMAYSTQLLFIFTVLAGLKININLAQGIIVDTCPKISTCFLYSEKACDSGKRRIVCISWSNQDGCPLQNTAADRVNTVCLANDHQSSVSLPANREKCFFGILEGAEVSFGISDFDTSSKPSSSFPGAIAINGSSTSAICSDYDSICSSDNKNDIKLTFTTSKCQAITTTARAVSTTRFTTTRRTPTTTTPWTTTATTTPKLTTTMQPCTCTNRTLGGCTHTCGGGIHILQTDCVGNCHSSQTTFTSTLTCNSQPCIAVPKEVVNGGWTEWQTTERCTEPCGGGLRTKERFCTEPMPANGGLDCSGEWRMQEVCHPKPCKRGRGGKNSKKKSKRKPSNLLKKWKSRKNSGKKDSGKRRSRG